MKKTLLICAMFLLACAAGFAQSSAKITELINTKETTYGQAAYMAAVFTGAVTEDASDEAAVKALKGNHLLSNDVKASDKIPLDELSYIAMTISGKKGGLLYTFFPGPRYAFRELKAKGVLPPDADPSSTVSGRDMIAVFNGCLPEAD